MHKREALWIDPASSTDVTCVSSIGAVAVSKMAKFKSGDALWVVDVLWDSCSIHGYHTCLKPSAISVWLGQEMETWCVCGGTVAQT